MRSPKNADLTIRRPRSIGVGTGVIVGMSIAAWWPAFTLGAWGTLFFDQLLTVWAGATAALLAVIIWPPRQRGRVLTIVALSVPSLWLVLAFSSDPGSTEILLAVVDIAAAIAGLLGIPFTIFVLAQIIWPDLGKDTSMSQRLAAGSIVVTIVVLAFVAGANHALFLTCDDFTISGNSEPPGCTPP